MNSTNEAAGSNEQAPRSKKKYIIGSLAAAFALVAAKGSYYTVSPSDMANITRLGHVVHSQPVGKGLHFKFPFIDSVDRQQVSLRTLHIPAFDVNTVDNQKITLDINFNYTVPANKVNELLYGIGKGGSKAIDAAIIPVAMDRAGRVFNTQNTTSISKNREDIQAEVTRNVFAAVKDQFGLEPHSLQMSEVSYSQKFVDSNEKAVREKNQSVAEDIGEDIKKAIATQKVIVAEGVANATVERARGATESQIILAEANKEKQKLDGEGQAARRAAEIAPFNGKVDLYLQYMDALRALKWDGQEPKVQVGKGGSVTTTIVPSP